MHAPECPRCLRLRRSLPEKTIGHCSKCNRWQFLYQAMFIDFMAAVHRHLACVECGHGAWCRDFVQQPNEAHECAYRAHKHPMGACVPRV